jgi:hypothetical protein
VGVLVAGALVVGVLVVGMVVGGVLVGGGAPLTGSAAGRGMPLAGCPLFPETSHWSARVDDLPVHPRSSDWVAAIGAEATAHPDFGSGEHEGGPIGIPYTVVGPDQPGVEVTFDYAEESDPGPYPIPPDALVEGGPDADGDRHVLLLQTGSCRLHELFDARPQPDGTWTAGSGAVWDLSSNALRPDGWTSADAAGLPILPGLVRYDEVAAGAIGHAIRFTAPVTDRSHLWPARHQAGAAEDPALPPMGARFRLTDAVDADDFPPQAAVVVHALQTHGAILADNGSAWFLSGVPDPRWDDDDLRALRGIPGSAWEAVDAAGLQVDPDSGEARGAAGPPGHYRRAGS